MQLQGLFHCPDCGKLHQFWGVGRFSQCSCGCLLYQMISSRPQRAIFTGGLTAPA